MTNTTPEPRYHVIINSKYASIAEMFSSDFDYCLHTLLRQAYRGPYLRAEIIDTYTNKSVVVMRRFL